MSPGALEGICDPLPFTIKGTSRIQLLWALRGESIQDHLVDPTNRIFPSCLPRDVMTGVRGIVLLVLETQRGSHRSRHAGGCSKLVRQGHTSP